MPPKVLLFGAGSVGTVYLYLLDRVASTTAVCRSNYDVVKKDGFIIHSSIFGQELETVLYKKPVAVELEQPPVELEGREIRHDVEKSLR